VSRFPRPRTLLCIALVLVYWAWLTAMLFASSAGAPWLRG
jgi:hypothetical protein